MLGKMFSMFKPPIQQKHIKVLVIEDTQVDQHLVCSTIEKGGYTALKSDNGKDGFELAKKEKPNLIILDYNLPDLKGPEVCKLLKTHFDTQNIPVIFLTSLTDPDYVVNCFEQGENYLAKPISSKLLLKQINSILNNPPSPN